MGNSGRNLVVVSTHGPEEELASVAFTVACGGMTSGLTVSMFLTGPAVDIVRKGAADSAHFAPLDPLAELILRLIRTDPDARIGTAREVEQLLERMIHG